MKYLFKIEFQAFIKRDIFFRSFDCPLFYLAKNHVRNVTGCPAVEFFTISRTPVDEAGIATGPAVIREYRKPFVV